jgi:hypothetical protein
MIASATGIYSDAVSECESSIIVDISSQLRITGVIDFTHRPKF